MKSSEQSNEGRATMAEIKTAEQRIHKLEGGEGDSFVTFEQALIAERDELRKALAERDAKLTALESAYIPTYLERLAASPATLEAEFTALRSEALDLRAALAERDAKLAALEKQEPVGVVAQDDDGIFVDFHRWPIGGLQIGSDVYAAAGAAPPNVLMNQFINDKVELQHKLDDALAKLAAGAAPVPTDTERAALIEKLRKTDWTISASDLADLCAEAATMLASAPKDAS